MHDFFFILVGLFWQANKEIQGMNSEMKSLKSEVKSLTDKLNHTETRKNQVSQ